MATIININVPFLDALVAQFLPILIQDIKVEKSVKITESEIDESKKTESEDQSKPTSDEPKLKPKRLHIAIIDQKISISSSIYSNKDDAIKFVTDEIRTKLFGTKTWTIEIEDFWTTATLEQKLTKISEVVKDSIYTSMWFFVRIGDDFTAYIADRDLK